MAERRRRARVLPGQGQHRLPHGHLAGDAARLRRRAARSAPASAAPPARQRLRDRVPDDGGQAVLDEPRHSIYLRDFLDRYDPDPLRYYLIAAGPETQDTDFTWAEFVRRNNDELLANWGNLVNRTLTNAHRNFGAVPEPGELTAADEALLARRRRRVRHRSARISRPARFRAALAEAMRLASTVNQYVSDQAPWALVKTDAARAATVLYVVAARGRQPEDALHAVPAAHLAARARAARLRRAASPARSSSARSRTRATTHEVLTGDYTGWVGSWEPSDLRPGQALREPKPLFRKLDDSIVDEELAADARRRRRRDRHARAPRRRRGRRPRARRRSRRVTRVVAVATTIAGARDALALADAHDGVYACLGVHPHEAGRAAATSTSCATLLAASEGGRRRRDRASTTSATTRRTTRSSGSSTRSSRSRSTLGKPVVIHTRAADDDTLARLVDHDGAGDPALLLVAAAARRRRSSTAGTSRSPATSPTRTPTTCATAARRVPADRLLVETDSPYLAPQAVRGRRNEPAYVRPHLRLPRRAARRDADVRALADRRERDAGVRAVRLVAAQEPRPALPGRREHPRRDRAARRARRRRTSCSRSAPGSACSRAILAERVAHVHAAEVDRRLEEHLAGIERTDGPLGRRAATSTSRALDPPPQQARREPAVQHRDADRRREPRARAARALVRDGAARGRRPLLRQARRRRRTAPSRCSSARDRAHRASTRSRARCSGRGRTSTPRSSRSAAPAPGATPEVKRVVEAAFAHRRKTLANSLSLAGLASRERAVAALDAIGRDAERPRRGARAGRVRRARREALRVIGPHRRRSTSRSSSGRCAPTASTSS